MPSPEGEHYSLSLKTAKRSQENRAIKQDDGGTGDDPSRKFQKQDWGACLIGSIRNKPTMEIKLNYSVISKKSQKRGKEKQSANIKTNSKNCRFKSTHIN